jgi:hypothetical protein
MRSSSREEIVEVFDALDADLDRALNVSLRRFYGETSELSGVQYGLPHNYKYMCI